MATKFSDKQTARLAMFLHNEFCHKENCAGLNEYFESAERLLPKIKEYVINVPETSKNFDMKTDDRKVAVIPLEVRCGDCWVHPGAPCKSLTGGQPMKTFHRARRNAAELATIRNGLQQTEKAM